MGYHPRIESSEVSWLITTRSRNARLWFTNNAALEVGILGYAARYRERYEAKLYALAIEGNHIHGVMNFPLCNRADYMRDFNSSVARAVPRYVSRYEGGTFWARRYSAEILPAEEDIEEWFFYTVLQPVKDGLVERISDYPGYNCFHDAVHGITRTFKVINWGEYNAAKLRNPKVQVKDFVQMVTLRYERLPGYENLSQKEYASLMLRRLEERRQVLVRERKLAGLGFVGTERLRGAKPGAIPHRSKTSTRFSHRPRVLCACPQRRALYKSWYFSLIAEFHSASQRYRSGNLSVAFPDGMYRPQIRPSPTSFTTAAF